MADAIQRRNEIGQQHRQQREQEQGADDAQESGYPRRKASTEACLSELAISRSASYKSFVTRGFQGSPTSAGINRGDAGIIDEAGAMTDGPAAFDPEPA